MEAAKASTAGTIDRTRRKWGKDNGTLMRRGCDEIHNRAEPHQHRQECLCHTNPAVLEGMLMRDRARVAQTLLSVLWQGAGSVLDNTFRSAATVLIFRSASLPLERVAQLLQVRLWY